MDIVLLLLSAYFLISLTALADKFILSTAQTRPIVYAFFISTLGLLAVVLIPFGFAVPSMYGVAVSALAGAFYTLAIFFLYQALRLAEVSRVFTTAGSLGAVLTFIFSYLFLAERLTAIQMLAFGLLIIGGIFIIIEFGKSKTNMLGLLFAVLAALSFGISYTATKATYVESGFVSGFVLIRVFAFIAIIFCLLWPQNRRAILQSITQRSLVTQRSFQVALFGGQAAAGIGFLILNYVISLSSAAIALAAQGLQYVFLFIATLFISKKFPAILHEKITVPVLAQKFTAIAVIVVGLLLLAATNV